MRVVIATVPLTGHVQPMTVIARALVARGHEVRWYGARKFAARIEATGAAFVGMRAARDWDDADVEAAFPALRGKRGIARVKRQLVEMFIAPAIAQLRDLEALPAPDVIVADQAHVGAALFAERHAVPWAGLGISALVVPSVDTAPFGSARPPPRNDVDRRIYRSLAWLLDRWVFRSVQRAYAEVRQAAGVGAGGNYFALLSPDLFLQPTIPSFEYPRSDLPAQVRFIGPLVPAAAAALPAWWPDVEHARVPIVVVTQGTLATDPRALIAPALRALAERDVLVVATTDAAPAALGFRAWPANARVAPFVPFAQLLPRASALVTNGGYGAVQMALAHGVPMVVAGGSEEKPEIAARVAWCGAGLDLRTGRPRAGKLGRAVDRVLAPDFAARARELAAECAGHDAPAAAVAAIEALARGAAGVAA